MSKHFSKLIAAVALLVVAVTLIIIASFAWMTFSSSPSIEGMSINVGGANGILVAPSISKTENGNTVHYPGKFQDKLQFSKHSEYEYLSSLAGLTPVSTADGISFYLPSYYTSDDGDSSLIGELKDISSFTKETTLSHANLQKADEEAAAEGNYVYVDFWVVSGTDGLSLRVASDSGADGSFVIALPEVKSGETGYELGEANEQISASARVGFLVNEDMVTRDDDMLKYISSKYYSNQYKSFRGVYNEVGESAVVSEKNIFSVFEPNADLHPDSFLAKAETGDYKITKPIGDGNVPVNIQRRIAVQRASSFVKDKNGILINQIFKSAIAGAGESMTLADAETYFYRDYLQNKIGQYITQGKLIKRASDISALGNNVDAIISKDSFASLEDATATTDVVITTLKRNVPQRIRMYVWLEGQDTDCINTAGGSKIAVSIQLAAGSKDY